MSEKRRFADLTDEEIQAKRQNCIPKNTERNNYHAAQLLKEYMRQKNKPTQFEELNEEELAEVLSRFYLEVRNKEGQLYKASTFENLRYSLNRYLKSPPFKKQFDIITSNAFTEANEHFKAAMAEIKKAGKGSISHHPMIMESDLKKLYNSIFLKPDTPSGLLNRVQMNVRLYFCRRANENMETMTKDTFVLSSYDDGTRYIEKNVDEMTKNHRSNDHELISGHMPEDKENIEYCPVETFLLYLSKLNPNCNRLWQYPKESFTEYDQIWYQNRPIGRDSLAKFMQNLSKKSELSQIYTNHCIRVTGTSLLSQSNFSSAQIMSITGHKSVSSLSVYQKVTDKEKQAMGTLINKSTMPKQNQLALPAPDLTLPAPHVQMTLPAPVQANQTATMPLQVIPPASSNFDADGFDLEQLFSDFNAPSTSSSTAVAVSVQRPQVPIFQGCSLGNVTININISINRQDILSTLNVLKSMF